MSTRCSCKILGCVQSGDNRQEPARWIGFSRNRLILLFGLPLTPPRNVSNEHCFGFFVGSWLWLRTRSSCSFENHGDEHFDPPLDLLSWRDPQLLSIFLWTTFNLGLLLFCFEVEGPLDCVRCRLVDFPFFPPYCRALFAPLSLILTVLSSLCFHLRPCCTRCVRPFVIIPSVPIMVLDIPTFRCEGRGICDCAFFLIPSLISLISIPL